ncbi:DinB family protein [Tunicatimonas pelagia]|uniref:DinB family protein n=1 Tax=Tunicatimonas pelagia TaxID=931531 RepID=UPI002666BE17|nr:DinB family protein [Tunicatimonas pelagia]WKN40668.1 DinB family protein [Tunicatimonas pelagia]
MNTLSNHITQTLLDEVQRRIIQESVPRIKKCLRLLSDSQIWHRPNEQTVSVGNLVLHLMGNLRQWVLSGIDGQPDDRQRSQEFTETGPVSTEKLIRDLDSLITEINQALNRVTPEALTEKRDVQGFEESVLSILIHVTEHFSYHTGQITYYTKSTLNVDTQYYSGMDLDKTASD